MVYGLRSVPSLHLSSGQGEMDIDKKLRDREKGREGQKRTRYVLENLFKALIKFC